jgi:plasmid stabilization system protein ParE
MARLLVREQAWSDLEELGAFIAKDNPAVANEVVRQLRRSFELLARMPQLGRAVGRSKQPRNCACGCRLHFATT